MRLRYKLPIAFAVTTLVFAGIVALVAALVLRDAYLQRLEDDMALMGRQFAAVLEQETSLPAQDPAYLQQLTDKVGDAGGMRLTLIAHDGTVLGDSVADPTTMENHATRPEVAQALAGNEGRARRHSATLNQEEVYVAVPLPAGDSSWSSGVVRTALPASRVDALVATSWRVPLIVWAVLLVPILVSAYFLTRSITNPLGRLQNMTHRVASGELGYRTSVRRKDELGDLATSLNAMASQLETQVQQLGTEKERLEQVLTAMNEGVIVVDDDGRLLQVNPAAETILQTPLGEHLGSPLVVHARAFPDRALAERAHAAAGPIAEIVELPGQRQLIVEAIPLHGGEGQRSQVLFVIRDETARLATDRIRRDFATNVSHELKTPLAGLSLLAGTLKHALREDPEQAAVFVDRLAAEIGRLTELAGDLLTLSHLEEPGPELDREFYPIDLGRVAEETASELRPLAEAKQQELAVQVAPTPPILGDEVSLRTLVRNLLDNAVRYTEPGGHISVSVTEEGGAGRPQYVVLAVKDDGVGIPVADQRRVFERFYRVDKARSRETGGTGLGLSIVRHVAERHGGQVEVSSALGSGSTFTVRIPAMAGPPAEQPAG
jgi:two-component system, OmpR family, phosphate regulon sensor histidine kinase PhoR